MSDAPQSPGKIRVLLVDDHVVLRQGMAAMIGEEPDLRVCGEADGVREAIRVAEQTRPTWRWWTCRSATATAWS